jgi:pimeloyl-ACP methyl ester carboxylesterase
MMQYRIIYLAGNSFPADNYVEEALCARLASVAALWLGQTELLAHAGEACFRTDIQRRLALLEQVVPTGHAAKQTVLVGRSSGGRVASLFASRRDVAAVICLGYPFREPGRVLDSDRFGHLARIAVPTLIVQGANDMYGGIELTETYPLSSMIRLAFVAADHALSVSARVWDSIAQLIMAHCNGTGVAASAFDENYYLQSNPDVAAAVARGTFASGGHHYRAHGRREGRSFRLLPLDVSPG